MINIRDFFCERVIEIEEYLKLVDAVEKGIQKGKPVIGTEDFKISVMQQKILYSGVYLHLYNLVEATITKCVAAIEQAASHEKKWTPGDLSEKIQTEWVRAIARTHTQLNPDNRLESAVKLCGHLVAMLPVDIKINKDNGGNWDDEQIFTFTKRLGLDLVISETGNRAAKKKIRDDMGPLKLIKNLRNKLAHGEISFGECGEGITSKELKSLKESTVCYMSEVIDNFESYIVLHEFLTPSLAQAENA